MSEGGNKRPWRQREMRQEQEILRHRLAQLENKQKMQDGNGKRKTVFTKIKKARTERPREI